MPRELRSGISFSGDTASIVVLEIEDGLVELKHLGELKKSNDKQSWFLDILGLVDKKILSKLSKISIAIENERVQLHTFPMDSSLTQVETNEQVQWELSNYISNFHRKNYITDLKILQTNAREQLHDVLAISIEKSFVFELHESLKNKKMDIGTFDVEYFAAEEALLHSHPEAKNRNCALLGFSRGRIDIGVISNSRLIQYRYLPIESTDTMMAFLQQFVNEFSIDSLFVYGNVVSFESQKALRKEFGQKYMLLNPFRRMRISPAVTQFSAYLGKEYRFACPVGSALRTEL